MPYFLSIMDLFCLLILYVPVFVVSLSWMAIGVHLWKSDPRSYPPHPCLFVGAVDASLFFLRRPDYVVIDNCQYTTGNLDHLKRVGQICNTPSSKCVFLNRFFRQVNRLNLSSRLSTLRQVHHSISALYYRFSEIFCLNMLHYLTY